MGFDACTEAWTDFICCIQSPLNWDLLHRGCSGFVKYFSACIKWFHMIFVQLAVSLWQAKPHGNFSWVIAQYHTSVLLNEYTIKIVYLLK